MFLSVQNVINEKIWFSYDCHIFSYVSHKMSMQKIYTFREFVTRSLQGCNYPCHIYISVTVFPQSTRTSRCFGWNVNGNNLSLRTEILSGKRDFLEMKTKYLIPKRNCAFHLLVFTSSRPLAWIAFSIFGEKVEEIEREYPLKISRVPFLPSTTTVGQPVFPNKWWARTNVDMSTSWCRHVHVRPHYFILADACSASCRPCRLELALIVWEKFLKIDWSENCFMRVEGS